MKSELGNKLFRLAANIGFRGGSLLAKFALMLYVTRYIGLEAVGILGLLQAANVIGTKVVGFGLYFVANREMVNMKPLQQAAIVRDQQAVYGLAYLAVIALTLLGWRWVPDGYDHYFIYSVILLVLGHQVLELGNILIAQQRLLCANIIFAITNGLWAFVLIPLGLIFKEWRTLDAVVLGWLYGTLFSFLLALLFLSRLPFTQTLRQKPDWAWIKKALWRGMPLYIAGLAQNGSIYIDRYVVNGMAGLELAGVFVMFWQFAYAVQVLVQTGLLYGEFPKLIADYKAGDESGFWRRFRSLSLRMGMAGAGFCLLAAFCIAPVIHFINQPLAAEHIGIFTLMLIGFWIKFQADVGQYALYARHQDKALTIAFMLTLLVTSIANLLCVWIWGIVGAAVALIAAALFQAGFQGWLLWRTRHERQPPITAEDVPELAAS